MYISLNTFGKWEHLNSFCLVWKAYAGSQTLQSIILLCTGTNKDGGYFAPKWLFLCMYMGLTVIWAVLNTFALEVIAFIDLISIWWQVKSKCYLKSLFGSGFLDAMLRITLFSENIKSLGTLRH